MVTEMTIERRDGILSARLSGRIDGAQCSHIHLSQRNARI